MLFFGYVSGQAHSTLNVPLALFPLTGVRIHALRLPCPLPFHAQVIANMMPFRENEDGSKGEQLPQIASGEGVDIILESGRCAEGLFCYRSAGVETGVLSFF